MRSQPERRLGSPLTKSILALTAFLTSGLLVEGGYRLWLRSQGRPYDSAETRAALERAIDDPDQLGGGKQTTELDKNNKERCLHPFFGFDVLGSLIQIGEDQEYFASGRGDETYDIVLLGGSVAAGFGNNGAVVMRQLIRQDPRFKRRDLRVMNYARASYKQPQQLNVLAYLLNMGIRPDAVVNLDGFNEVAQGNANVELGVHPLQPSVSQWAARTMSAVSDPDGLNRLVSLRMLQLEVKATARRALSSGLLWSSIAGSYWLGEMSAGKRRQVDLQSRALKALSGDRGSPVVRGPAWEGELEEVIQFCAASWMASSRAMHALCEAAGIHYVHVLQPTLHDAGSKPVTDDERRTGKTSAAWRDAVRVGYPLLRAGGEELRGEGVAFIDATRVFEQVTETLYHDACHFSREGQEMLGERIAAGFLATHD